MIIRYDFLIDCWRAVLIDRNFQVLGKYVNTKKDALDQLKASIEKEIETLSVAHERKSYTSDRTFNGYSSYTYSSIFGWIKGNPRNSTQKANQDLDIKIKAKIDELLNSIKEVNIEPHNNYLGANKVV
jgi:hypothetical protein